MSKPRQMLQSDKCDEYDHSFNNDDSLNDTEGNLEGGHVKNENRGLLQKLMKQANMMSSQDGFENNRNVDKSLNTHSNGNSRKVLGNITNNNNSDTHKHSKITKPSSVSESRINKRRLLKPKQKPIHSSPMHNQQQNRYSNQQQNGTQEPKT